MNKYLEANKRRWDQLALEHKDSAFYDLEGFKAGKDRLRSIELSELGDVQGKTMLHLQCHFGLDSLAWARRGAAVTGADFSQKAIALAQSLGDELAIPTRFVCADVYQLPELLSGEYEIVFTSYGVLHWLPDLEQWAEVISHFLSPGGIFYMVEDHPLFRIFRSGSDGEIRAERDYFRSEEPQCIEETGSYASTSEESAGEYYIWDHSLGEVIQSLIDAGLQIEFLHEFPYAARAKFPTMVQGEDGWWRLPGEQHRTIPFLFSLKARKPS